MKPFRHNALIKTLVDSGDLLVNVTTGEIARVSAPSKPAYTHKNRWGYPRIEVCRQGKRIDVYVHRLVAYALWGDAIFQPGIEIDHIDRNRANTRGDNLRMMTQADNTRRRAVREGWHVVVVNGEQVAYCKNIEDADYLAEKTGGEVSPNHSRH